MWIVRTCDEWGITFLRNEVFLSESELKFTSSGVPPQRSMYAATRSLCAVSRDDQGGGEATIVLRQRRHMCGQNEGLVVGEEGWNQGNDL